MPLRIDEVFVFMAQDEEGEGVAGFLGSEGIMWPMVCADKARVDSLRGMAQQLATAQGKPITLLRFSVREEVEVIQP